MDIYEKAENVTSKADFVSFLELLMDDLKNNKADWENDSLNLFLDGIYGYSMCKIGETPSWNLFAEILLTARIYE